MSKIPLFSRLSLFVSLIFWVATASAHPKTAEELALICKTPPSHSNRASVDSEPSPSESYAACRTLIELDKATSDTFYYIGRLIGHANWDEAASNFEEADVRGNTKATVALGWMVENHRINERQTGEGAEALYRRAAQNGDPVGQIMLAYWLSMPALHLPVDGPFRVASDEEMQEAQAWLQKAMAKDYAPAYYIYARYYAKTKEGHWESEADKQRATQMLHKAAQGGVAEAIDYLDFLSEDTSPYKDVKIRYPDTSQELLIFERP